MIVLIIAMLMFQPTYVNEEIQDVVRVVSEDYGIDESILLSIIETESSGKQYAENGSCKGLCQIAEEWHQDRMDILGVDDIYDIEDNIRLCADYLNELYYRYEDWGIVLGLYNGNSNTKSLYGQGRLTYYAQKVLNRANEIRSAKNGKETNFYIYG